MEPEKTAKDVTAIERWTWDKIRQCWIYILSYSDQSTGMMTEEQIRNRFRNPGDAEMVLAMASNPRSKGTR